jgi:hypothetical protein
VVREESKGMTLVEQDLMLSTEVLNALEKALGTPSAAATSRLVPYFGATIGGESTAVEGLGLDLSRALLAGLKYDWRRPFIADETVHVRVAVEDVFTKGDNQFGVLSAEFSDPRGELVQSQQVTFIERGQK